MEEIENSKQWKVNIVEDDKFPFIVIDNWYSKNEEIAVWKELDYYFCNGNIYSRAENNTDIARIDGKALGKTNRLYLDNIYNNRRHSIILNMLYKQRSKQFKDILEKTFINHYTFSQTDRDSTLISYYEDSDYYDRHIDTALFTCLIWLHKLDKPVFDGGDFILDQADATIKFKNNRLIFFPSWYYHTVTPISIEENNKGKNLGRYTITHFYNNA